MLHNILEEDLEKSYDVGLSLSTKRPLSGLYWPLLNPILHSRYGGQKSDLLCQVQSRQHYSQKIHADLHESDENLWRISRQL